MAENAYSSGNSIRLRYIATLWMNNIRDIAIAINKVCKTLKGKNLGVVSHDYLQCCIDYQFKSEKDVRHFIKAVDKLSRSKENPFIISYRQLRKGKK